MFIKKVLTLLSLLMIISPSPVAAAGYQNLPAPEQVQAVYSGSDLEQLIQDLSPDATLDDPFLLLVNPYNPSSDQLSYALTTSIEGLPYAASIESAYNALLEAGQAAGYPLTLVSGYRTSNQQEYLFSSRKNGFLSAGYSEADAEHLTSLYTAPANATEHMTGYALDILGQDWIAVGGGLTVNYADYPSAIWLAENAPAFGFILRYPYDKTNITTFNYEPWHCRYVGTTHSIFISKHGITLEEYISLLEERDRRVLEQAAQEQAVAAEVNQAQTWLDEQSQALDQLFQSQP